QTEEKGAHGRPSLEFRITEWGWGLGGGEALKMGSSGPHADCRNATYVTENKPGLAGVGKVKWVRLVRAGVGRRVGFAVAAGGGVDWRLCCHTSVIAQGF